MCNIIMEYFIVRIEYNIQLTLQRKQTDCTKSNRHYSLQKSVMLINSTKESALKENGFFYLAPLHLFEPENLTAGLTVAI